MTPKTPKMATKFYCFRAHSPSFAIFSYPVRFIHKPSSLPNTLVVRLFSSTSVKSNHSLPYGPSLQKGKNPFLNHLKWTQIDRFIENEKEIDRNSEELDEKNALDEDEFTRIYEISAIRVPARDCFALESRLRGHLLNWPRIRNIARVPGDEVEDDVLKLLGHKKEEEEEDEDSVVDSVNRRMYGKAERDGDRLSPVLYREKLARTFNSTGYAKFRNLAKISRPARKRKQEKAEGREQEKGRGRSYFAVVEVAEDGGGASEMEGLLGKGYGKRGKWRGSTRLLLLDERDAGKTVKELPEAIKVVMIMFLCFGDFNGSGFG